MTTKKMTQYLPLFSLALLAACSSKESAPEVPAPAPAAVAQATPAKPTFPATLQAAVDNPARSEAARARDVYRHPVETLSFFGVEPQMTVVEIWPGAGWYTQVLAPYLATSGRYIGAQPGPNGENVKQYNDWLAANPEVAVKATTAVFNPPKQLDFAPEGSVDMVLTFRNIHNWMMKGNQAAAFKSFYKALKPGGVLGVVEHRANGKGKSVPNGKSGYVLEADVIRMAKAAGFKLDKKSEVNANPKDTKDYPDGVWTLPPTFTLGDKDREKYLAIGESDRMTLRFIKK